MSVLQALVLGAVQGLTEFIPISSSGHLVLVPAALDWNSPGLAFDVLLHAASLIALITYFGADLWRLLRGAARGDRSQKRLLFLLALGTVPAVVAGVVLADFFERSFEQARAAALQLLLTAVILVIAELLFMQHVRRGRPARDLDQINAGDSLAIGVAQAISILPGISRSGATIGVGLALGIERAEAARFAFLLAVPALLGASLVQIPDLSGVSLGLGAGAAGFGASLIASYAAIAGLLRYLRTRSLYPFAVYCAVAGIFFYAVV